MLDHKAPTCPKCAETGERKQISVGARFINAVMVGRGSFYDEDGKHHSHTGSAGGKQRYSCACGHSWTELFGSKFHTCWCGWGKEKKTTKKSASG